MITSPERISRLISKAVALLSVASLLFVPGCSRNEKTSKSNEFFVTWLQSHGETNVVMDAAGVGLAGNATRLRSSLDDSEKQQNGTATAETEFRVRLPDGRCPWSDDQRGGPPETHIATTRPAPIGRKEERPMCLLHAPRLDKSGACEIKEIISVFG